MKAELIGFNELNDQRYRLWQELSDRSVIDNPFFSPGFAIPAIDAVGNGGVAILALSDRGGDWRACMPLSSSRGWHKVPLKATTVWNHMYGYLGMPLLDPADPEGVLAQALLAARKHSYIGLDLIPAVGMPQKIFSEALKQANCLALRFDVVERAGLYRHDGRLALPLSKKRRREVRRLTRRLGEKLDGTPELVDRGGDSDGSRDFLKMEQSGWKGREGTALASNPHHARFFRRVSSYFAQRREWRLFSLRVNDTAVAMLCAIVSRRTLYGFKIAFDERYSEFSPGILLHRATIDLLDREGEVQMVDTCAYPNNETANRLYPDRIKLQSLAIPADNLSGVLARGTLRVAANVRQRRR